MLIVSPKGRLAEWWFAPRSFESERFYERLGVRLVKKYIPTGGSWWNRIIWHRLGWHLIDLGAGTEGLVRYEALTRDFETIHLSAFAVFTVLAIVRASSWSGFAVAMVPILLITVPPVMLQRYNRLRLQARLRHCRGHASDFEELKLDPR